MTMSIMFRLTSLEPYNVIHQCYFNKKYVTKGALCKGPRFGSAIEMAVLVPVPVTRP